MWTVLNLVAFRLIIKIFIRAGAQAALFAYSVSCPLSVCLSVEKMCKKNVKNSSSVTNRAHSCLISYLSLANFTPKKTKIT